MWHTNTNYDSFTAHLPVMKESQIRPRVGVNLRIFSVGALDNSTAIGIAPHRARRTHPTATHTFAMPTATLSASASLGAARSLASTRAAVRTSVRRVAARSSRPGSIRGSRSRSSSILTMAASASDVPADAVEYFSPSKVNLFLRVVRRRDDGYHDLASLFHVIDLGDDMKFAKSTGSRDTLVCSDDTIPLDSSNLVIKALDLWRAKTGSTQMFWVELVKNVPHGAGLGGGSGNAATAMWAANELCGR